MTTEPIRAYCVARIESLEREHAPSLNVISELKCIIGLIDGLEAQMALIHKAIFEPKAKP